MSKYIVCSGCSFTRQEFRVGLDGETLNFNYDNPRMWRWPHWIQKLHPKKVVYNLGNPTNDNNLIATSVISKITELIKKGINPKEIKVFIQWSDMVRESFYIPQEVFDLFGEEIDLDNSENENVAAHTNFFANKNKNLNKFGHYIISAGSEYKHIPSKVRKNAIESINKFMSIERATIRFYHNVLLVQNFLKQNKIDYLMFNYPRNVSLDNNHADYNWKNNYINKKVPKQIFDFKYDNPYIDYFVDNVDWDKFWFYKDENTNIGGLIDFAIMNYDYETDEILFMEHQNDNPDGGVPKCNSAEDLMNYHKNSGGLHVGHISSQMNKKFVEKILRKYLEN